MYIFKNLSLREVMGISKCEAADVIPVVLL